MDYLFLYLLGLADTFIVLKVLITIVFLAFAIGMAIDWCGEYDKEEIGKLKKVTIILGIVTALVLAVPTKESLLLMGGLHYGKQVITNERIEKINKVIDLELDKRIQRLTEDREDK